MHSEAYSGSQGTSTIFKATGDQNESWPLHLPIGQGMKRPASSLAKYHEPASPEVSKGGSSERQSHCLLPSEQVPSNIDPVNVHALPDREAGSSRSQAGLRTT